MHLQLASQASTSSYMTYRSLAAANRIAQQPRAATRRIASCATRASTSTGSTSSCAAFSTHRTAAMTAAGACSCKTYRAAQHSGTSSYFKTFRIAHSSARRTRRSQTAAVISYFFRPQQHRLSLLFCQDTFKMPAQASTSKRLLGASQSSAHEEREQLQSASLG